MAFFFLREKERILVLGQLYPSRKKREREREICTTQYPIFNSHINSCKLLPAQKKKDDKIKIF